MLVAAAVLVVAAVVVAMLVTVITKTIGRLVARRYRRIDERLRPELVRIVADATVYRSMVSTRGVHGRRLDALTIEYLPKVRGDAHRALIDFLERRGVVRRAYRRARRFGAFGRAQAADLLGNVPSAEATTVLERLLRDRDPAVRSAAARGLGHIGDPGAVPHLLSALDGRRRVPAGIVGSALLRVGSGGVDALRTALQEGGSMARAVATEVLGFVESIPAAADLIRVLEVDPSGDLRSRAARALGRIGAPVAVAPLVGCLGEEQPTEVRAAAAWALGHMGATAAVPALSRATADVSYEVAHAAAEALAEMGSEGRHALESVAAADLGCSSQHAREALVAWDLRPVRSGGLDPARGDETIG